MGEQFYRISEDLPDHQLRVSAAGFYHGFHLDDKLLIVFYIRHRLKACWVERSILYAVDPPDDWLAEPVLLEREM